MFSSCELQLKSLTFSSKLFIFLNDDEILKDTLCLLKDV